MKTRVRIDSLHVDMRGIDPALADAVVPLLGPALQAQFSGSAGAARSAAEIDAGRVASAGGAHAIARRIARQVVNSTRAGSTRVRDTREGTS
jgi:hypothetical protein